MIRVLLADDHEMVRKCLAEVLDRQPDLHVVGEAENGTQAVSMAAELRPDVVIVDYHMPKLNGVESTRRLREEVGGATIIGLTMLEPDLGIASAMREAGATACLSKDSSPRALIEAIRNAVDANPRLRQG